MCFRSPFNQDISKWGVSNVKDMLYMFAYSKFDKPIGNWDVSGVKNMVGMFYGAQSFNQNINKWKISPDAKTNDMFQYCNIKEEYKPKGIE